MSETTKTAVFLTDDQAELAYGATLAVLLLMSRKKSKSEEEIQAALHLRDVVRIFDDTFVELSGDWRRDAVAEGLL